MNEIQEQILKLWFPDYEVLKDAICEYSDYELKLLKDVDAGTIDEFDLCVLHAVQWDIVKDVIESFVNDDFYYDYEDEIMDYCVSTEFIHRDGSNSSYVIDKNVVIQMCEEIFEEYEKYYPINRDINMWALTKRLNAKYPLKFTVWE